MPVRPYKINGIDLGYDFDIWTGMTHEEAASYLKLVDKEFAQSLYMQSLARPLSAKQCFWAQVLALESQGIKVR